MNEYKIRKAPNPFYCTITMPSGGSLRYNFKTGDATPLVIQLNSETATLQDRIAELEEEIAKFKAEKKERNHRDFENSR